VRILVFGAGSLGSLVGGLLARAHEVTLVGRDPHVSAVRTGGLELTGEVSVTVRPRAATAVPDDSFDLALVTTKAYDTPAAVDSPPSRGPTVTSPTTPGRPSRPAGSR